MENKCFLSGMGEVRLRLVPRGPIGVLHVLALAHFLLLVLVLVLGMVLVPVLGVALKLELKLALALGLGCS